MMTSPCGRGTFTRPARRHHQRGQALTEMAIAAVVLVPLFLLASTLAKYVHIKQSAQQAARSAAWQATVTPDYKFNSLSAATQRKFALDRHFGTATQPIVSAASTAAEGARVQSVMMNSYDNRGLLRRQDVAMGAYQNAEGGMLMSILSGFSAIFEIAPGEFPPNSGGKVTAQFTVRPLNIGANSRYLDDFRNLNLEMAFSHTVFADPWSASGNGLKGQPSDNNSRSVYDQVCTLYPSCSAAPLGDVLDGLDAMEILPVVGVISRLRPGYQQPDIVPVNRLKPYNPN